MDKVKQEYVAKYLEHFSERWESIREHEQYERMAMLMTSEYKGWLKNNDLPKMSADELLIHIKDTEQ